MHGSESVPFLASVPKNSDRSIQSEVQKLWVGKVFFPKPFLSRYESASLGHAFVASMNSVTFLLGMCRLSGPGSD